VNAQRVSSETENPAVVFSKSSAPLINLINARKMKSGQSVIEHAKTLARIPNFLKFAAQLPVEKQCAHVRKDLQEKKAENASRNSYEK
jgi:hypothetical protein